MQQAALFDEALARTDLERFLGSCPNCGVTVRVGAVETGPRAWQIVEGPRALLKSVKSDGQSITAGCPHCHSAKVRLERVEALHTEEPCNAACMFARGPRCECSCGGENHGAGFGLMFERLGWLDMAKAEPAEDADRG